MMKNKEYSSELMEHQERLEHFDASKLECELTEEEYIQAAYHLNYEQCLYSNENTEISNEYCMTLASQIMANGIDGDDNYIQFLPYEEDETLTEECEQSEEDFLRDALYLENQEYADDDRECQNSDDDFERISKSFIESAENEDQKEVENCLEENEDNERMIVPIIRKAPFAKCNHDDSSENDMDEKCWVEIAEESISSKKLHVKKGEVIEDDSKFKELGHRLLNNASDPLEEIARIMVNNTEEKKKDRDQSLTIPYLYAQKILSEGKYRYIDSPAETEQISTFNGRYWEPLTDKRLKAIVYSKLTEDDRLSINKIQQFCTSVLDFIKHECEEDYYAGKCFSEKDFDSIKNRVVFQNTVYDVQLRKTMPFDSGLPYYFGVAADYLEDDVDTPYYDKLKRDASGADEDSMDMLDLAIGYLLIPNRSGKCMFVMANARDSGKSLLGSFLARSIEGNRSMTIDPEHLNGRFAYSRAANAVLYTCLEMSTKKLTLGEVREFKKITGDDSLRSEQKYHNEQNIKIRFKLLLATNGGILLEGSVNDPAFYRRVICLPFIKSTPLNKLISNMSAELDKERSAIISKAVRKLHTIINNDGGIVFPESKLSKKMKDNWSKCIRYEEAFMKQAIDVTGNENDMVSKDDIYEAYCYFYESNNLEGKSMRYDRSNLITFIKDTSELINSKKARRDSVIHPLGIAKPKPCLCGINLREDFLEELRRKRK